MLRSLIAIIVAAITGLVAAKFIEGAAQAGLGLNAEATATFPYQLVLIVAWGVGAFAAALTALLIGRRWAPLSWLAAASILFAASMTIFSFSLSWILWPATALATGAGALAANKLVKAKKAYPAANKPQGLFRD